MKLFVQQLPSVSPDKKDHKLEKNRWSDKLCAREGRRNTAPRFFAVVKDGPSVDPKTPRKRKTRHSNNPPVEHHVGWIMDVREHHPRTYSTGFVIFIRYEPTAPNQNILLNKEVYLGIKKNCVTSVEMFKKRKD